MLENDPFRKQKIDPSLMNSLDKMGNSNAEEWFPLAKGKKTASPPPAPVVQPTQPVVVPPSVSSPPAEPIPHPSSQTTVEGSQAINKTSVSSSFATPSTEKPSKRHRLLLIPMALTLMMALVSIVFKALNLSFISRGLRQLSTSCLRYFLRSALSD